MVSGIRFRNNELFLQYLEDKFGKKQVEAAFLGRPNTIELSMIYNPEINSFRGVDTVQIIVEHYQ